MNALYFLPKYYGKYTFLTPENFLQINQAKDLSGKIEKMIEILEIPATEYNERRAACAELLELFRKYYPDCLLLQFGSTVSGLATKHCDLNLLFLPFPSYCNSDFGPSGKTEPLPDPASVLSGETSKDVLAKFDEWSHLKFVRNILRREKPRVKKINFIPTKSPTLKIYLTNMKLHCDISASNKLVVFNSELLQFLTKLDKRVKPLIIILRFWARSVHFLKKSFFSSYGFTLLIIFFLQNTNPPILPSVKYLMEHAGYSRMTAGWQTAFITDENSVPKTSNTQTLGELMMQFFDYYWNFDFVQNVISPYYGKALPVKDIRNSQDEKMDEVEEMFIHAISIQDPFIHSLNCCKREGPKIVFKLALHVAYQILQDKSENMTFQKLFDPAEYQKVFDLHYEKYMLSRPKVCFISLDYALLTSLGITDIFEQSNSQLWYEKATQAVFDVLQYGLLMECEVTDKVSWDGKMTGSYRNSSIDGKHKELIGNSSMNGQNSAYDLELLLSIQCILYSRTWIGRKHVKELAFTFEEAEEFQEAALKAEYNISRELVKTKPLLNSSVPLLCFKCDCYRHTSPQISDIVVMLKPLSVSREFYQVSVFLSSYIPKTVKKILTS